MALPNHLATNINSNVRNYSEERRLKWLVQIRRPETAIIIHSPRHFDDQDLQFLIKEAKGYSHYVSADPDSFAEGILFTIW